MHGETWGAQLLRQLQMQIMLFVCTSHGSTPTLHPCALLPGMLLIPDLHPLLQAHKPKHSTRSQHPSTRCSEHSLIG